MPKDNNNFEKKARVFKALGHPSRLRMIDALSDGEKCVCELRDLIGCDLSTVSKHLSVLREAGVADSEKRGANIYYRLKLTCLREFLACAESAINLNSDV